MASPSDFARPNGRKWRRSAQLTRQQRLGVSIVAAALGLLCAWVLRGGGRRRHHPVVAVEEAQLPEADQVVSTQQQLAQTIAQAATNADVAHQGSEEQVTAGKALGGTGGGGGGTMAAAGQGGQQAAQQQQPKGKQAQELVAAEQEPQQQQQQQQSSSQLLGMEDEREWFDKLSTMACAHAERLRVCSHRGRLAAEGVPPGSLGAYPMLHKGGVSCYDIDLVQTRDGQLVASHPEDLCVAVGAKGPPALAEWSLAELRAAGADEERFPTADALIKVFAALLEQSGLLWKGGQGRRTPDYEELPVLLMDLKGEAFNPDTINSVAVAAQAVDAEPHVVLFVVTPEQLALVLNQTRWGGPLIRGFMDREDANPALPAEALAPFALLGPSIKMADSFFAAATQLGKPVLAWTVDSPTELYRVLQANLNAVISNRPLAVRGVLLDWRDRCSELQRRALQAAQGQLAQQRRQQGAELSQ